MANQELYDKSHRIPPEVLQGIQASLVVNPHGEGVKRAKFMLNNGTITYQAMKRLKNFFDNYNPQTNSNIQFALAGGQPMKAFIDTTLNQDRNAVQTSKEVRRDITTDTRPETPYETAPVLNEEKKELDKNAVGVIVNNDNKILLLKRGSDAPWMPSKWSLVGGGIEKGEDPEVACKREIKEETGLEIDEFVESFTIQRQEDSEETIFACRHTGEDTDIELDKSENTNYGWYDMSEMEYLELVPHLIEYITLVFKKYD